MCLLAFDVRRFWFALCALLFLAGCSPKYDWREVHGDSGTVALFPDKPKAATRVVELGGVSVNMTMQLARVDDLSFALAWADLPLTSAAPADATNADTARLKALAAMRAALIRNFGGQVVAAEPVAIARAERGAATVSGEALDVAGSADGKPVLLQARLAGHGTRVWQLAVYGPAQAMRSATGREAAETFLLSVRLH